MDALFSRRCASGYLLIAALRQIWNFSNSFSVTAQNNYGTFPASGGKYN